MMSSTVIRIAIVAAGVLMHAGCGGLRTVELSPPASAGPESSVALATKSEEAPPPPNLEEAVGKIRRLMAEARPPARDPATRTLETGDPELMAALAVATAQPTAAHYDEVAAVYYQRGLLDRAHDYSNRSLRLEPARAAAHERLARIWRDWGVPHLALADVHRAVYYAPKSASARNTLGTILQSLGQRDAARRAYDTALALDDRAAYVYNNLCYLSFLEGRTDRAMLECRIALELAPQLIAARNNLALTYAAAGRPDLARSEFARATGPAVTAYNMGIVYMSLKRFDDAAGEFAMAHSMSPPFTEAARRAGHARQRASEEDDQKR
jgi:tetratricopeptide (TPR) repeat protein